MAITRNFFNFKIFIFFILLGSAESFGDLNDSSYLRKYSSQIRDFENYLFSNVLEDEEDVESTTSLATHSVLIMKDGKIIYEKYAHGYDKDRLQKLFSISKSVTSLLIAMAVKEKKISLQDNLCVYLKDYETQFDCKKVTIEDILGWSSGIQWKETFIDFPLYSSIFNLLYNKEGYGDSTSFILSHPLAKKPGYSWHYSSGDTNLLMSILSKVYSPGEYATLPWTKLFNPLGIKKAVWETDRKGVFSGCCSLYLTTRSLGRIGQFMLNKGEWMGRQLLPEQWIQEYVVSTPPSFIQEPVLIREQFVPGFHWWVNKPSQHGNVLKPRALISAPQDMYLAIGYSGQFLFIIPSLNTVIVRTGLPTGTYVDSNAVVGMALNIITGQKYTEPFRQKHVPFSIGSEYEAPRKYQSYPISILNNFIAKEVCSCMFVEGGQENSCKEVFSPYTRKFQTTFVDKKRKMVQTRFLAFFASATAYYEGRYGCRLQ